MLFQRLAVILPFIAEQVAKGRHRFTVIAGAAYQPLPIVMPDLMAKMSEQCSVWLMHLYTNALTLGIVGFHQIDRDQPIVMSGDDARCCRVWRIGEEIESQALLGILVAVFMRQVET